ncbi:MAG TPA: preprotein translocase subunit SecG [Opitutae bacterium]|nr:preprotein translocase subunit SecG [Opitutae bacterium]
MGTLLISLLTLILLVISAFIVLIILMQRTSSNGGMGAALGGGAAESAFGSETNNILTKGTIYGTIAFFLVSLGLYLIYQSEASKQTEAVDVKELITSEAGDVTAETTTTVVEIADGEGTIAAGVESVTVQAEEVQTEVDAVTEAVATEVESATK